MLCGLLSELILPNANSSVVLSAKTLRTIYNQSREKHEKDFKCIVNRCAFAEQHDTLVFLLT